MNLKEVKIEFDSSIYGEDYKEDTGRIRTFTANISGNYQILFKDGKIKWYERIENNGRFKKDD